MVGIKGVHSGPLLVGDIVLCIVLMPPVRIASHLLGCVDGQGVGGMWGRGDLCDWYSISCPKYHIPTCPLSSEWLGI